MGERLPELFAGPGTPSLGFVRQFTRGLGVLLNHYLTVPVGVAEAALDRPELPAEIGGWFHQIIESCQRSMQLLAALEDLSTASVGDLVAAPLATLVREFLDELPTAASRNYELKVDFSDTDAMVRVNRRMLRTVLRNLLSNAEHAVANVGRRQIAVRVSSNDEAVRCEVQDSGTGLRGDDWASALAPFFSTKGPFARDAAQAAQEAVGLGLTVGQHLLALHGGHLELRGVPGEGTTAALVLPRAVAAQSAPSFGLPEPKRLDAAVDDGRAPHARPGGAPAPKPSAG